MDSLGPFVDGLKFTGGCHSLMGKELVREITDLAHKHDIYVSTGDWAEHLLRQGPSSFKQYVEVCGSLDCCNFVICNMCTSISETKWRST